MIHPDELLARFIFYRRYFRDDNTIRPEAFIPHPYNDLSVTRHLNLNESQLRDIGESVALESDKTLHGRADITAKVVSNLTLSTNPDPTPNNPNHAIIIGWPEEKSKQKTVAQLIAASISSSIKY